MSDSPMRRSFLTPDTSGRHLTAHLDKRGGIEGARRCGKHLAVLHSDVALISRAESVEAPQQLVRVRGGQHPGVEPSRSQLLDGVVVMADGLVIGLQPFDRRERGAREIGVAEAKPREERLLLIGDMLRRGFTKVAEGGLERLAFDRLQFAAPGALGDENEIAKKAFDAAVAVGEEFQRLLEGG